MVSNLVMAVNSQGGSIAISAALDELTTTAQSFLGMTIMLLIIASMPLFLIGGLLFILKGRQGGTWRTISLGTCVLGILAFIGAIAATVAYLLVPSIIQALAGG